MIDSEAVVARVEGEYAWLDICKPADCESCGSAEGCGLGRRKQFQRVRNTAGARVGDTVIISVASGAVLKAALVTYLLPLVFGLFGAVLGTSLGQEPGALVGILVGLGVGVLVLRFTDRRVASGRGSALIIRVKPAVIQLRRNQES